eukprot:353941-Chlamydomonas_euryale.AAC.3
MQSDRQILPQQAAPIGSVALNLHDAHVCIRAFMHAHGSAAAAVLFEHDAWKHEQQSLGCPLQRQQGLGCAAAACMLQQQQQHGLACAAGAFMQQQPTCLGLLVHAFSMPGMHCSCGF